MLGWHDTRPLTQLLPEKEAKAFARHFGYRRAEDLLMHLPRAYAAHGAGLSAGHAQEGDIITCIGDIVSTSERRDRNGNLIYTVEISDGAVTTTATFFRANWLSKVLVKGARGMFTGKLKFFREKSQLQHPDFFFSLTPAQRLVVQAACKHYLQQESLITSPVSSTRSHTYRYIQPKKQCPRGGY